MEMFLEWSFKANVDGDLNWLWLCTQSVSKCRSVADRLQDTLIFHAKDEHHVTWGQWEQSFEQSSEI